MDCSKTKRPIGEALPYWLAFNRLPGFGPQAMANLRAALGEPQDLFHDTTPIPTLSRWLSGQGLSTTFDWTGVSRDLSWLNASQHHIVTLADPAYPSVLRDTVGAPIVLFVNGNLNCLLSPQIAMVGSRHPSSQGREQAFEFGAMFAASGLTVTSGLALGIDGASHEGALYAGGETIAVLGHGLDSLYPAAHKRLAERIIEKGALVSEFPVGVRAQRSHFPRRNRVISGLSGGVLVVEAAMKSGSLITAHCALEQGRSVFALPGSVHNPTAKGCHYLIRQGAELVETATEIIEHLTPFYAHWQPEGEALCSDLTHIETTTSKEDSKTDHVLLAAIGEVTTPIDVLIQRTGLSLQHLTAALLDLEVAGQVTAVPGGYVRIATGR